MDDKFRLVRFIKVYAIFNGILDEPTETIVNAWHYTLNMDRPRGIRFHLKNGKSVDTEQFVDEELIKLELDNIKSKLTQIIPHQ